jgi:biotin carboxylase
VGLGPERHRRDRAVLFVDDEGWASFDQAAAGLRRKGLRIIRVTASKPATLRGLLAEPALRWLGDRLFFDEVLSLANEGGRRRLAQLAAAHHIADVIISEPTLQKAKLDSEAGRTLVTNSLAFRRTPAQTMLDKFEVNRALAAAGVPVPEQLAPPCTPAEAVERLGLPLIIKAPTGAAGYGVRLARTLAETEHAVAELRDGGQEPFFQAYAEGSVVMYGAVLGPGGKPLIEHGFRVEQAQSRLGPSAAVSLYDRDELIRLGRRAADLFRPEGFAAFGFIETPDGRLLHIDANLRVWGNVASPLKLGINYLEAYAALISDRPWAPPAPRATASSMLRVYPYALFEAFRTGSCREIVLNTTDFITVCRTVLGSRYCLQALGQAALLTRRRTPRRRSVDLAAPVA